MERYLQFLLSACLPITSRQKYLIPNGFSVKNSATIILTDINLTELPLDFASGHNVAVRDDQKEQEGKQ